MCQPVMDCALRKVIIITVMNIIVVMIYNGFLYVLFRSVFNWPPRSKIPMLAFKNKNKLLIKIFKNEMAGEKSNNILSCYYDPFQLPCQ